MDFNIRPECQLSNLPVQAIAAHRPDGTMGLMGEYTEVPPTDHIPSTRTILSKTNTQKRSVTLPMDPRSQSTSCNSQAMKWIIRMTAFNIIFTPGGVNFLLAGDT